MHERTRDTHRELIVRPVRAGLVVSPAGSKIGNFNGVSTAVVVSPPLLCPTCDGGGGGEGGGGGRGRLCPKYPTMCRLFH